MKWEKWDDELLKKSWKDDEAYEMKGVEDKKAWIRVHGVNLHQQVHCESSLGMGKQEGLFLDTTYNPLLPTP